MKLSLIRLAPAVVIAWQVLGGAADVEVGADTRDHLSGPGPAVGHGVVGKGRGEPRPVLRVEQVCHGVQAVGDLDAVGKGLAHG